MRVEVIVKLKNGVLDPQGKAIHHALHSLGYDGVSDVSVGKIITLEVEGSKEEARKKVEEMCQMLLANIVIEDYEIKM